LTTPQIFTKNRAPIKITYRIVMSQAQKQETISFETQTRSTTGTGAARELRRIGRVPAVVYGEGQQPLHVSLPLKDVTFRANKKNFKSTVFELALDGKKIQVVAKDIQFNPVTDVPEHVDLQFVSAKTSVKVFVPILYINQAKSPGLKKGGVLNVVAREIEFYVNPAKIPTQVEVDLTGLEIGNAKHIKDITLPEGAKAVNKTNFTLATVVGKGAEEPTATEAAAVAPGAVPAANAGAPAAAAPGAAPAAGAGAAKTPAAAGAKAPAAAPAAAAKPAAKK